MKIRLSSFASFLLFVSACMANPETGPLPMEWSTYRIGEVVQGDHNDGNVHIFRSRAECEEALEPSEIEQCLPFVDRATGQVKIAFRLETKMGDPIRIPLQQEQLLVSHRNAAQSNYELIPHRPMRVAQLFILLIDGSGSMYENNGEAVTKVYNALMDKSVIDNFFPKGVRTGVVLLRFTDGVKGFDGGAPVIIESRRAYKEMIRDYMMSGARGWTHLYDAVEYTSTDFLRSDQIQRWLQVTEGSPTIVALTDGYNNEKGSDTCETNAPRLQRMLTSLSAARRGRLGERPTVYTIGLGRKSRRRFELPQDWARVSGRMLCGKNLNGVINAGLEKTGIDNASLEWIAKVGGGKAFTRNNARGLAKVFKEAAAKRYEWYELFYQVDPIQHRRTFETKLRLLSFLRAESSVTLYPSPWLDVPGGERTGGARWVTQTPFRRTFIFLLPLLSALLILAFLGPAGYNARRAVFRRSKVGPQRSSHEPGLSSGDDPTVR